jgi:hypothetical protein
VGRSPSFDLCRVPYLDKGVRPDKYGLKDTFYPFSDSVCFLIQATSVPADLAHPLSLYLTASATSMGKLNPRPMLHSCTASHFPLTDQAAFTCLDEGSVLACDSRNSTWPTGVGDVLLEIPQVALSASHKAPFLNVCRNNTGCVYPSAHVLTLDEWIVPPTGLQITTGFVPKHDLALSRNAMDAEHTALQCSQGWIVTPPSPEEYHYYLRCLSLLL